MAGTTKTPPKTSPKTGTRKPGAKPGQGSIEFDTPKRPTPLNPKMTQSGGLHFNSPSPAGGYTQTIGTKYNAQGPNHPRMRAGQGGRPMVSSPVTNPGAAIALRPEMPVPGLYTGGAPRRIPGGKFEMPGIGPARPRIFPSDTPSVSNIPPRPPSGELVHTRGQGPDFVPQPPRGGTYRTGGVPKGRGKAKLGLALLAAATAGGVGYLASRSRNNETAAAPGPQAPEITVPGRNAPPSAGNGPDRGLYPDNSSPSPNSNQPKEPGLSERARNNQRANRSPDEYLGEAFDATVKRGRSVGRKHLQGMIVRDSVDEQTASELMSRYDKEINSQSTLKNYRDRGVTQEFDKANPSKAGRLLDEYRSMGRSTDGAPRGATLAELKARALK